MKRELEEILVKYVEAYEAGGAPSLDELVVRHAQYRDDLVDFAATLFEVERAVELVPNVESASVGARLRLAALEAAFGPVTLREAMEEAGVTAADVAAAANVPPSFVVGIGRGQLLSGSEGRIPPKFLVRLGSVLRRTVDEIADMLRASYHAPAAQPRGAHARQTRHPRGGPRARRAASSPTHGGTASAGSPPGQRPPARPFAELLATCADLTPAQRREWLDGDKGPGTARPEQIAV